MSNTFVYDPKLDPHSHEPPLERLLAKCKELDPGEWPDVSIEEFLDIEPDALGRRLVRIGELGMRRYDAARTLLPALAGMVEEVRRRLSNESADVTNNCPYCAVCRGGLNRLAADALPKLKGTDDVAPTGPAEPSTG